jgi:hypothetical protein
MSYDSSRALPALDGMGDLGDAVPALPSVGGGRTFVRLPNGVVIDPVPYAGKVGVPVSALLAAVTGVWRARSPAEAQNLVDQVERAYGLPGTALQSIAASRMPVVAAAPGMQGFGNIFGDAWDYAKEGTEAAVGFVGDTALIPISGGTSLLLPSSMQPSGVIQDPKGAAQAAYDGVRWFAKAGGTLTGKTAVTLGKSLLGGGAPAAPPPVQQASMFGDLSLTSMPVLLGAAGLLVYLLLRKKPAA